MIPLTKGQVAIVDEADFAKVGQFKWYATHPRHTIYAARGIKLADGRTKTIYMHRFLMDADAGEMVDHKDHNGLNNTRENLRKCTVTQNNRNIRPWRKRRTSSAFKGVHRNAEGTSVRWSAKIKINGKLIRLGEFTTEIEAARAYDSAARQHFGEFACVNFP
jgi:hypothetical protein